MIRKQATLADLPGGAGHEHASWLIGPVGRSRDSDLIEESNFHVARARMLAIDPDEHDHEVHRFGHFAVGWVEEIACRPGSDVARLASEIRESLDGYGILDEHDHSRRESDAVAESWSSWQAREVRRDIVRELVSRLDPDDASPDDDMTSDEIEAWLDEVSDDRLWTLVHDRGEIYDGALHLSARDIERAATALVEARDEGSEVQPTE